MASKGEAEAEAEKLRTRIREGSFRRRTEQPTPAPVVTTPITWEQFARTYLERRGTPATVNEKGYLARIASFELPGDRPQRFGSRPLSAITADDLEVVFAALRAEGRAASTRNKYRLFVGQLYRWGVRKGYTTRNPLADADTIHHESERDAQRSRRLAPDVFDEHGQLTREGEERCLLRVANPILQRRIVAGLETGVRLSELKKVVWADVDLVRGELTVRAANAKTRRTRVVPISARLAGVPEMARSALEATLFDGDETATEQERSRRLASCFVFGDALGLKVESTRKAWQLAVLRAHGYEPEWADGGKLSAASLAALKRINLHFHDLRHEAGSRLIEAGWPLHHVQQMLGHADLKQTSTYLNATLSGLKESMRKFDEARRCKAVASEDAAEQRPTCNEAPARDENLFIH